MMTLRSRNACSRIATLETENCGQRLWPRRPGGNRSQRPEPTAETGSARVGHGNAGPFATLVNRVYLCRQVRGFEPVTPTWARSRAARALRNINETSGYRRETHELACSRKARCSEALAPNANPGVCGVQYPSRLSTASSSTSSFSSMSPRTLSRSSSPCPLCISPSALSCSRSGSSRSEANPNASRNVRVVT